MTLAFVDDRFACNVSSLPSSSKKRHFAILTPALIKMVRDNKRRRNIRELPNGFAFGLPLDPEAAKMAVEWAVGERICCPFLNVDLTFEGHNDLFWLRVTGGHGVKEFIEVDFADWFR